MRYVKVRSRDVANGPGLRVSVWISGCSRHCKGCFNQELADFNAGKIFTPDKMQKFATLGIKNKEIVGFSILGGEPLEQNKDEMIELLNTIKHPKKTIWMWTGYTYEELTPEQLEVVKLVDILVDGPFIEEKKNYKLKFRGSSNQRIIDIKSTMKTNKVTTSAIFS